MVGEAQMEPLDQEKRLRVLMYEPTGRGGHAWYARNLLVGLEGHVDATLVTSAPYELEDKMASYNTLDICWQMVLNSWHLSFKPLWAADRLTRVLQNGVALNTAVRTHRPDIVHLQHFVPLVDSYFIPKLSRLTKVVLTVHNVLPHKRTWYNKRGLESIYRNVERLVVHTVANASELQSRFGIAADRISVIPHGVEIPSVADRQTARKKLGLPGDRPILLFFGQIRAGKGLDVLLQALHIVKQDHPDVMLLVVGHLPVGEVFSPYQNLITSHGLDEFVECRLGYVPSDDVSMYFSAADISVLPYTSFASQSGVLMQSIAHGCPVVVSSMGGMAEVVQGSGCGRVVEAGDVTELADTIRGLLTNPALVESLRRHLLTNVRHQFDWKQVGTQTANLYKALVR